MPLPDFIFLMVMESGESEGNPGALTALAGGKVAEGGVVTAPVLVILQHCWKGTMLHGLGHDMEMDKSSQGMCSVRAQHSHPVT